VQTCKVINNRIIFTCPICKRAGRFSIHPTRNVIMVVCVHCGEKVRCKANRRKIPRSLQEGRVYILTKNRKDMIVADLMNISRDGACLRLRSISTCLSKGSFVEITCDWNRRLFPPGKHTIVNKRENRIGIKYNK
jgi:Zn ribbon nucleic-acid-binding protein